MRSLLKSLEESQLELEEKKRQLMVKDQEIQSLLNQIKSYETIPNISSQISLRSKRTREKRRSCVPQRFG